MSRKDSTGALIGLVIGTLAGAFLVWLILRKRTPIQSVENTETWKLWEDAEGNLLAEVHRKVKPSE